MINYSNKQLTAGRITIVILDDEAKHSKNEKLRGYELSGKFTAKAKEENEILNILTGKKC